MSKTCEICERESKYKCSSSFNSDIVVYSCEEHKNICIEVIEDLEIMKKIEMRDIKDNGKRYSVEDILKNYYEYK